MKFFSVENFGYMIHHTLYIVNRKVYYFIHCTIHMYILYMCIASNYMIVYFSLVFREICGSDQGIRSFT